MNEALKRCPKCEVELPVSRFNKRANGRCVAYCKACQSLYARKHYVQNADVVIARSAAATLRYKARNRAYVREYLLTHPCVDCGKSDPIVLEFDHRDPRSKESAVADLIRQGYSVERIRTEIERCDVRCVTCHRRRTAKQFHWNLNR